MKECADGTCSDLAYFLTDHLGSVVAVTDEDGALVSEQRYYALRTGAHGRGHGDPDRPGVHGAEEPGCAAERVFAGVDGLQCRGSTILCLAGSPRQIQSCREWGTHRRSIGIVTQIIILSTERIPQGIAPELGTSGQ